MTPMRRALIAGLALVVALLVAAQLLMPGIATDRVRDRLKRDGAVEHVEVHAVPAVRLLFGDADRVVVRMGATRAGTGRLADLLAETGQTDRLDASATSVDTGVVTLRDATLRKRGDRLTGSATITDADIRAALPPGLDVRPIASAGGELVLRGSASVLGLGVSLDATLRPVDGKLVITPDVPLGNLATITVFSDRRVRVEGVAARAAPGGGFIVTAQARLVG